MDATLTAAKLGEISSLVFHRNIVEIPSNSDLPAVK